MRVEGSVKDGNKLAFSTVANLYHIELVSLVS